MQPLADRLRPSDIALLVGQKQLFGENGILSRVFSQENIPSMIFWGPAGTGKTTVARLLLAKKNYFAETISATNSGVSDLKRIFELAKNRREDFNRSTILFIDEVHCFKKNQQDVLLPYVENGTIVLIGATTENPSFELNSALLSRCRVLVFRPLAEEELGEVLERAEARENKELPLDGDARRLLISLSSGDCRYLLNMCEELFSLGPGKRLGTRELLEAVNRRKANYDKKDDNHYNLISAFHKSIRGSDVQAALYWMARIIDGGDEYHFLFRRLMRAAAEDIGMADPQALVQVTAALEAFDFVGPPEGQLFLSQAVIYCATAPKSNACYLAEGEVFRDARENNYQDPPKHILNAPTKLMRELGYGDNYIYDHNTPLCFSGQNYFPSSMGRRTYYRPNERGFEREIARRLAYWDGLRGKNRVCDGEEGPPNRENNP
ncbi:MAG: replication-associated recombination protein A [Rickettsiales bacterium]|jgi:putative ATPase|nr:replication-associated recombination protein A [Rickettsiales bacterium]